MSVDPDATRFPHHSPFCYAVANPLRFRDCKGRQSEEELINKVVEHKQQIGDVERRLDDQLEKLQQLDQDLERSRAYYEKPVRTQQSRQSGRRIYCKT